MLFELLSICPRLQYHLEVICFNTILYIDYRLYYSVMNRKFKTLFLYSKRNTVKKNKNKKHLHTNVMDFSAGTYDKKKITGYGSVYQKKNIL